MKILIVTGIFPPDIGGPASYVPEIAEALCRKGHLVQILTLSDNLDHLENSYPFEVLRIKRGLLKPYRWLQTVVKITLISRKSDIIYVNGLAFEAMLASFIIGKPTMQKVVGDYAWERARGRGWFTGTIDEYQKVKKGIVFRVLDIIRTLPLIKAKKIITPSGYLKQIITGWGICDEKIDVIYNAVSFPSAKVSKPILPYWKGITVITVCRLVPWKGLEQLIHIATTLTNIRLVIVGDGPIRNELKKKTKDANICERVLFQGHVDKPTVASLLSEADIFVLNSTYEGLPHAVLEAMHAGIPVIATRVGGTTEVVFDNETGILIPPNDTTALVNAIKKLSDEEDFKKRICHNAIDLVKNKFSFSKMVTKTDSLFKSVGHHSK